MLHNFGKCLGARIGLVGCQTKNLKCGGLMPLSKFGIGKILIKRAKSGVKPTALRKLLSDFSEQAD